MPHDTQSPGHTGSLTPMRIGSLGNEVWYRMTRHFSMSDDSTEAIWFMPQKRWRTMPWPAQCDCRFRNAVQKQVARCGVVILRCRAACATGWSNMSSGKRGASLGCTSNMHISPKITIPSKKAKKSLNPLISEIVLVSAHAGCVMSMYSMCVFVSVRQGENICWRDDSKNLIKSHLSRWEKNPQLSGQLIIRGEWPAVLTKHTWTHTARRRQKKKRKENDTNSNKS